MNKMEKDIAVLNLDTAQKYAEKNSTCAKVQVGSMIVTPRFTLIGVNHGECNCIVNGCRRIKLYGENSKEHRLPSDCDAVHSEIDAIGTCAKLGISTAGATIYITRYPCESCARAIVAAGISQVIYGREQEISEYTQEILSDGAVEVIHLSSWTAEDVYV